MTGINNGGNHVPTLESVVDKLSRFQSHEIVAILLVVCVLMVVWNLPKLITLFKANGHGPSELERAVLVHMGAQAENGRRLVAAIEVMQRSLLQLEQHEGDELPVLKELSEQNAATARELTRVTVMLDRMARELYESRLVREGKPLPSTTEIG